MYEYKLIFEPSDLGGYNITRKNVERLTEGVLAGTIQEQGIPVVNAQILMPDGQIFKTNEDGHFQGVVFRSPVFVAHDAAGANNGRSWRDAFNKLEDAVKHIELGDEIWVKKGVYKPGTSTTSSFTVNAPGIKIFGGFAGDESQRSQRDWIANPTVLSGEIGDPNNYLDNIRELVDLSGNNSVLDGFIIERSSNVAVSVGSTYHSTIGTVSNCIIRDNIGTAIGIEKGQLINSMVINNKSSGLPIVSMFNSSRVENCIIAYSTTIVSDPRYGNVATIHVYNAGKGEISGCTIVGNVSKYISLDVAGAISVSSSSEMKVTNSIISGNSMADSQIGPGVKLESSCVFGEASSEPNVFTFDPQFLDVLNVVGADGILMTDDDGLQLSATSPLINLGNIIFTQNSIDVARQERIAQGAPDIGAYESNSTRAHEKPAG